jgi:hypothetical protein
MAQMHITASPVWDAWSEFLSLLPADLDLDRLARTTKAIQRRSEHGIGDAATLLQLALARGPGGKSLPETAAWARQNHIADITGQSLNERLHRSVAFFAAITHHLLAQRPAGQSMWAGRCLRIADGSSISQPGSQGTDWRLHGVYDLQRGGFAHLELTSRYEAESLLRCEPAQGEVLIADRGYARARELRACLTKDAAAGRDFIVRVGWKALAWRDPHDAPFDLIAYLQSLAPDGGPQSCAVQALAGSAQHPCLIGLRLIAVPLPREAAEANRRKLLRTASKHQNRADPRSLIAAGYMVLVTSLPETITAAEICAAYRLRWQIELAFKRLKSLLGIDRLPTRTEAGGLSWLYPHLILLLLTEDLCQEVLESSP